MKKTARICIVLLLVLLLAGCTGGNKTEQQPEATAAASVQETAAPETPTDELAEEDFRFCFLREDGELDEEASPMFLSLESLLKPMSTEYLDNIVKPVKDLMKGVSIGA